jgi:hypothetical protein
MGVRFDTISAYGSSVDLFGQGDLGDLAGFIVDALRVVSDPQGRRDSAREKSELVAVGRLLDEPVNLERLSAAVNQALGSSVVDPALSVDESQRLRDFYHSVVSKRQRTSDRLDELFADLRELANYQPNGSNPFQRFGPSPLRARIYELDGTQGIHEFEMSREILARAVARAFTRSSQSLELLVIAGADKLAPEVLESLKGSAEQLGKQLVLLFTEMNALAQRSLGTGGTEFALFLRLPNADDAEIAAKHFGRQFTFVINGISIAEGKTDEWNRAYGITSSTSRTSTKDFGTFLGGSIARSFSDGTSSTNTSGGSQSRTTTTSSSRVHDYIIEPETFQQLEEFTMLVANGGHALLANCDFRLRKDPRAANYSLPAS